MKNNFFRIVNVFVLIALGTSIVVPTIQAQDESYLNKTVADLQANIGKLTKRGTKFAQCLAGAQDCTEDEISHARTVARNIGKAVGIITAIILSMGVAKRMGWIGGKTASDTSIQEDLPLVSSTTSQGETQATSARPQKSIDEEEKIRWEREWSQRPTVSEEQRAASQQRMQAQMEQDRITAAEEKDARQKRKAIEEREETEKFAKQLEKREQRQRQAAEQYRLQQKQQQEEQQEQQALEELDVAAELARKREAQEQRTPWSPWKSIIPRWN